MCRHRTPIILCCPKTIPIILPYLDRRASQSIRALRLNIYFERFIMKSVQESETVYSDRWLTLHSSGTLVVRDYYFPTASSRTIHLPHIKSVATGIALNLSMWKVRSWGVPPSWIYWALDWERGKLLLQGRFDEVRKRCLVITTDEGWFHRIGVSCENTEMFLSELEKLGVEVLREPIESHTHLE